MSVIKAGLLALMVPAALAAPAAAQGADGERPRMIFSALDADGDGSVTLEEMRAAGANRFAEADADGDGALTRAELIDRGAGRVEARVDRMLERMDADGDGSLTQAEMDAAREGRDGRRAGGRGPDPERIFARFDADGDGAVTEAEFDAGVAQMRERGGRRQGGEHGGGHGDRDRG